ncbi:TPA: Crp/Fnr family transcriptional regulator [Vibrio cholerae]|nr:Crp/Fnr family transcriptional regulator [Vibrio cholerae]HAS3590137.1 Crp/Fnr family transcriptional regulator [Vibrio cholerae]
MQLTANTTGRFSGYLNAQLPAFRLALSQCQTATKRFDAGEALLQQGQPVESLYVVSCGRVSMNILAANGRRFQLGEVQCDDHLFGEMEFFTAMSCQWNVVAEEPIQAMVICAQKLQECLEQQPVLSLFFASALAQDYQESLDIYTQRLMHSISFNIAYDLLLQHETRVNLGGFERMEPEAERFGTSSRVYRRAVKELVDRGLVEKGERGLIIKDLEALRAFVASFESARCPSLIR